MKVQDFKAIQDYNPTENKYLTVVKDKSGEHLEVKERSFLGKIWMKLGFSSSSLEKVANYVNKNISAESINNIDVNSFKKLDNTFCKYIHNHNSEKSELINDVEEVIHLIIDDKFASIKRDEYLKKIKECEKEIEDIKHVPRNTVPSSAPQFSNTVVIGSPSSEMYEIWKINLEKKLAIASLSLEK